MTSADRIEKALNHGEPDKVPFDLGSTTATGIHKMAYERLLSYLGYGGGESRLLDTMQQLADVDEFFLEKFNVDTRGLMSRPCQEAIFGEDGDYKYFGDEWGVLLRMPKERGLYYDMDQHPLAGSIRKEDIKRYAWPDPTDPARIAGLEEKARWLEKKATPAFVLRGAGCVGFEMCWNLRGFTDFCLDLAYKPSLASYLMDKVLEFNMKNFEFLLERLGQYVSIVYISDDIAGQEGTLISPEMYRKYFKPRHKKLFSFIKRIAPRTVYIFFHCCGAVSDLIPDLIEAEVDILNPIQVSAANMDTGFLKKEFGQELTFWGGGVDTQHTLPFGTPNEVREEVKRRINDLAPGGGFVFSTIHNVQPDVPLENFLAMWETLQEFGVY